MSASPRPEFFVARADGTLTPMIAVDELPSSFRIVGVPATITPAGTQNMISLGLKERSNQCYAIVPTEEFPSVANLKTDTAMMTGPATSGGVEGIAKEAKPTKVDHVKMEEDNRKVSEEASGNRNQGQQADGQVEHVEVNGPASQAVDSWRKKVQDESPVSGNRPTPTGSPDKAQDKGDDTSSTGKESKSSQEAPRGDNLPSSAAYGGMGTKGTLGKKVYCTHWIRWGECDYTQQGCLYKHEMPDEAKLQEIGIATCPRWYRIANPEKFNGVTEGPEWYRRPGPAPTDQLWRGPPPAHPVEPQTYEDFRANARPAPSPAHRQPFGPPNHSSGPVIFAFDPNANTFHSFGSIGNYRSGYVEQPPRQSFNRTPVPRVVNMQPPFVRQQRPGYSGTAANDRFSSNPSTNEAVAVGTSGSTQSTAKITEIADETPSAATHVDPTPTKSTSSPSKVVPGQTNAVGSDSTGHSKSAVTQGNPNSGYDAPKSNPAVANGTIQRAYYGQQQSHPHYVQGTYGLDVWQPLTPSPASAQRAAATGDNSGNPVGKRYVQAPKTPPVEHKRFFQPPGHSAHARMVDPSVNVPNGGDRKKERPLLDV